MGNHPSKNRRIETVDKMNNHLIILGIAVLLICVGLSGCDELTDTNMVSFNELRDHLGKYVGKEITVKGYVSQTLKEPLSSGYAGWAFFHESNPNENPQAGMAYINLLLPENITLYRGWYKVTGLVEESQGIITIFATIDVTSAEAI